MKFIHGGPLRLGSSFSFLNAAYINSNRFARNIERQKGLHTFVTLSIDLEEFLRSQRTEDDRRLLQHRLTFRSMRNQVKSSRRSLSRAALSATKDTPRRERAEMEINLRKGKWNNSRRLNVKVNCVLYIRHRYLLNPWRVENRYWRHLNALNPFPFHHIYPSRSEMRRSQLYLF